MFDLVKKEMASEKKNVAMKAIGSLTSGDALSDTAAAELIRTRLLRADHTKGMILDGFPATAGQAKELDRILEDQRLPRAVVVVLDVPDEVIRKRLLARHRADDKPEIIDGRIRQFRREAALLAGWASQTDVIRVNADAKIADVSKQIVAGLEGAWSNRISRQQP